MLFRLGRLLLEQETHKLHSVVCVTTLLRKFDMSCYYCVEYRLIISWLLLDSGQEKELLIKQTDLSLKELSLFVQFTYFNTITCSLNHQLSKCWDLDIWYIIHNKHWFFSNKGGATYWFSHAENSALTLPPFLHRISALPLWLFVKPVRAVGLLWLSGNSQRLQTFLPLRRGLSRCILVWNSACMHNKADKWQAPGWSGLRRRKGGGQKEKTQTDKAQNKSIDTYTFPLRGRLSSF